ncbi:hypothetical protein HY639_04860 [Candidatus Woesearchaeota archaeon]|nr:hypothetical protein [Candidatus Woesearchaeota archaeon]
MKPCKICIVKRAGHLEEYDERKIYASCYSACLNAHIPKKDAETICEKVAVAMTTWAKRTKKTNSQQIFRKVISELRKLHKDAAFMYETHRDVS